MWSRRALSDFAAGRLQDSVGHLALSQGCAAVRHDGVYSGWTTPIRLPLQPRLMHVAADGSEMEYARWRRNDSLPFFTSTHQHRQRASTARTPPPAPGGQQRRQ